MTVFLEEIRSLEALLVNELGQERVNPGSRTDLLALEQSRARALSEDLKELQADLTNAGDLIESLKDEIAHETKTSDNLRAQLAELTKTRNLHGSTRESSNDSEAERRLRLLAERELDAYRRQPKASDITTASNARRVAVALARHCAELSHELDALRGCLSNKSNSDVRDILSSAIFPGNVPTKPSPSIPPAVKPSQGWGLEDDDDLFSSLN